MENYYNDENLFTATKENIQEKIQGYILIPIYWGEDDGQYDIDTDTMRDEFFRTLYGIETVLESINEE
jgi:hypothetical protein